MNKTTVRLRDLIAMAARKRKPKVLVPFEDARAILDVLMDVYTLEALLAEYKRREAAYCERERQWLKASS